MKLSDYEIGSLLELWSHGMFWFCLEPVATILLELPLDHVLCEEVADFFSEEDVILDLNGVDLLIILNDSFACF
jgi:hypothetical protein